MADVVERVLVALKGNNLDKKVEAITQLEDALLDGIALEPNEISHLTSSIRDALKAAQAALSFAALAIISPLVTHAAEKYPKYLNMVIPTFAPSVIDKLGDAKDKTRDAATKVLLDMWCAAATSTSNAGANHVMNTLALTIKDTAFAHKSWRVREQVFQWLRACSSTIPDFSLRQWAPLMVKLLEDQHEQVREASKETIIVLFGTSSPHAKSDLKRELKKQNIRSTIADNIKAKILSIPHVDVPDDRSTVSYDSTTDTHTDGGTEITEDDILSVGTQEENGRVDQTPSLSAAIADDVAPIYVASARDLEREFQTIIAHFQGKETEDNWQLREKDFHKIRSLLRGEAVSHYKDTFVVCITKLLDAITDSLVSLRTALAITCSICLSDLIRVLNRSLDPLAEKLLPNLIKMSSTTKKLVSQAGTSATTLLLSHCSYHYRLVNMLSSAMQDKNLQLRISTVGWLKAVVTSHADRRDYIERSGGAELLEKCVKKGLTDASPKVREGSRELFWLFYQTWTDRGEGILKTIEPAVKKQLERDRPSNVVVSSSNAAASPSKPSSTLSAPRSRPRSTSIGAMKKPPSNPSSNRGEISPGNTLSANDASRNAKKDTNRLSVRPASSAAIRAKSPAPPPRSKSRAGDAPSSSRASIPPRPATSQAMAPLSVPKRPQTSASTSAPRPPPARKLTVLEQLNNSDPSIRVHGIIQVADLIQKRSQEPPAKGVYAEFKRSPLPPDEELGRILTNLLNDPVSAVLENLLHPDVIAEIKKVLSLDIFIPQMLLNASEDSEQGAVISACLPDVKAAIGSDNAISVLGKCLFTLGASGGAPRRSAGSPGYQPAQKRKIIHGILLWLNEILIPKLVEAEATDDVTGSLGESANYKSLTNRLIPMITTFKEGTENHKALSELLINMHKLRPDLFEEVLFTFDRKVIEAIGSVVGWEDELAEAEEAELEQQTIRLQEGQILLQQQEIQRQRYEQQLLMQQQEQLQAQLLAKHEKLQAELQAKQEELEKREREFEMQQKEREAAMTRDKEREIAERLEKELSEKLQRELQEKHNQELKEREERELQKEKELEEQRERERQMELQRERELQEEAERQREYRERQLQMQREYELEEQQEIERQQQLQREREREREIQEQQERERELQLQREREIQEQEEREREHRERQLQIQRERELHERRERDIQDSRDRATPERRDREFGQPQTPSPRSSIQLQSQQKPSRQNTPPQMATVKDNVHDWIENQRSTVREFRENDWNENQMRDDDYVPPKDNDWNDRDNAKRTSRDIDWDNSGGRRSLRDPEWFGKRGGGRDRDVDRQRGHNQRDERSNYSDNNWPEKERRAQRDSRDADWEERNQRGRRGPRDPRDLDWDGRDRRPLREPRDPDWDNRARERRRERSNPRDYRDSEWDDRRYPSPRGSRDYEWEERGRPIRRTVNDHWEAHNERPSPREYDYDDRGRPIPRDPRDIDWDERAPRESSRASEGDWDERGNRGFSRNNREFDRDDRSSRYSAKDMRDERSRRVSPPGSDYNAPEKALLKDSEREGDDGRGLPNGSNKAQDDKPSAEAQGHLTSQPMARVVSLPPSPEELGITDVAQELSSLREIVENLDLESDSFDEEIGLEKDDDSTITRPIRITEDTWKQLASLNNSGENGNFVYDNVEDRLNENDDKAAIEEGDVSESQRKTITPNDQLTDASLLSSAIEAINTLAESVGTPNTESQPVMGGAETETTGSPVPKVANARQRALRRDRLAGSPGTMSTHEKGLLLATLLARLNTNDVDKLLLRKLERLSKETPLSDGPEAEEVWEDGGRFGELINALLTFFEDYDERSPDLKETGLQLLQQLLINQTRYVAGLERDVLRVCLDCRADLATNVSGQADEVLETYVQIVDVHTGLYALIDIMESRMFNSGYSNPSSPVQGHYGQRSNPKAAAFMVLARLVRRFEKRSLEREVGKIVPLAIRAFNDTKPEIRKAVVDSLVSVYSIIGDDNTMLQYLTSLNPAQQRLLHYYFDKSKRQQKSNAQGVVV